MSLLSHQITSVSLSTMKKYNICSELLINLCQNWEHYKLISHLVIDNMADVTASSMQLWLTAAASVVAWRQQRDASAGFAESLQAKSRVLWPGINTWPWKKEAKHKHLHINIISWTLWNIFFNTLLRFPFAKNFYLWLFSRALKPFLRSIHWRGPLLVFILHIHF